MKTNGVVRKIDELGRIVIPMEFRNTLDLNARDSIQISLDDGRIILSKVMDSCVFCGSQDRLKAYRGKLVCGRCATEVKKKL